MLDDLLFTWLFNSVLAPRPQIYSEGEHVVIRTDWRAQMVSLGFGSCKVTIDRQGKCLRYAKRRFWFFTERRRIEFDWVQEVIYRYRDLSLPWGAHRSLDRYTVGLWLKDREEITLFSFVGEGEFVNNSIASDFWYAGDRMMANLTPGMQDQTSLAAADALSRAIGVPMGDVVPYF